MKRIRIKQKPGFTLVELLVVIGIIAMLIGLLMPTLSKVRLAGQRTKCLSNLHSIGTLMLMYANDNNGLLIPLGPLQDGTQDLSQLEPPSYPGYSTAAVSDSPTGSGTPYCYMTLGTEVYPWMRWPALLLRQTYTPIPTPASTWPTYLAPETSTVQGDPFGTFAQPWTSNLMVCPSDPQPGAAHSYLFNEHLVQDQSKVLKYFSKPPAAQQSNADVVVLGEKRSSKDDYYMEQGDFPIDPTTASPTHVELYRHGVVLGSNYLYKDMHAQNNPPQALSDQVDPWDIVPNQTQTSSD
jgi:prepilin-type N-terminal cleavage/methylation domain-containing protein